MTPNKISHLVEYSRPFADNCRVWRVSTPEITILLSTFIEGWRMRVCRGVFCTHRFQLNRTLVTPIFFLTRFLLSFYHFERIGLLLHHTIIVVWSPNISRILHAILALKPMIHFSLSLSRAWLVLMSTLKCS